MLYLLKDSSNDKAANDAAKLLEAWAVKSDRKRLEKATNFLKFQAAYFANVARYGEVLLADPIDE